ncbi:YsnF/AvaK domain-containing protein [Hymenobacter sp. RP-2-7]|uniref:YsnF/AvaK domain-containing protein n=1 Tax=Hymenobacter polaris TaxID=2682546 RepID=A0A7Y0FKM0_9BACT|nr:YsnF/AvaK domain-containing protein [Hymenobacter polaris]NML63853.1 YsnF/AvaK domain-containing protein [Hymenobacter polaris]
MKNQTVVGIFNTADEAKQAVQKLSTAGFERNYVDISQAVPGTSPSGTTGTQPSQHDDNDGISGFFSSLFGGDDDEARTYAEVARSGHSVVTVHVDTAEQAHRAADILDDAGALDVNSKAAEYGLQKNYAAGQDDNQRNQATQAAQDKADGMTAKVIEEKLEVGKRTEQTGGVRLRSRIVEKPVEASVRLREEHVTVQRTPVNRPATEADFKAFKEGDLTVTESAERAVVAKEAHVVEEVLLGKNVTEREETIHETVRNTEVDVEQIPANQQGNPKQS